MNTKSTACAITLTACIATVGLSLMTSEAEDGTTDPSVVVAQIQPAPKGSDLEDPASSRSRVAAPSPSRIESIELVDEVKGRAIVEPTWVVPSDGRHIDPTAHDSAEEMLSALWGPLYDDVMEELEVAGLDLSTYPFQDVPSWDDLKLDLYPYLDEMLIESSFDSSRPDEDWTTQDGMRSMLQEMREDLSAEDIVIDPSAEAAFATLSESIHRIELNLDSAIHARVIDSLESGDGGCKAFPIALPRVSLGTPPVSVNDFAWYQTLSINGWAVDLSIRYDEAPEFVTWKQELDDLIQRRFDLLAAI